MVLKANERLMQARERIWGRLATLNPIVHRAVQLWRRGVVSWEEALILMVERMDEVYRSMQEEVTWESRCRGFIVELDRTCRSMQEEATWADYPGEFGNRNGRMKPAPIVCSRCKDLKTNNVIGGAGPTEQVFYLCYFTSQLKEIGLQLPYTSPSWCPRRKCAQIPQTSHPNDPQGLDVDSVEISVADGSRED